MPQSARDVFALLATAQCITPVLAERLQRMVGFRYIAVHDDQTLKLPITVAVITEHLGDFLAFSAALLTGKPS